MAKTSTHKATTPSTTSDVLAQFWHRERFVTAFLAAALALSFAVPWLEIQGKSLSGLQVLFNWSDVHPMVHDAMWNASTLLGIALLIVYLAGLALIGWRSLTLPRTVTIGLIWGLAALSTWPATVIFLNSQSENVKQVVLILGYWFTLFGSAATFVYCLVLLSRLDAAEIRPTHWFELAWPGLFVAICIAGALINYKWVNYELVPPATKVIRAVKTSR